MLQILFAVLAGILTVGSPCVLPILPILFGASVGQQSKTRPLFITLGFVLVFSIVGIILSVIVSHFHFNANILRNTAIIVLAIFGLFMLWPLPFEKLTQGLNGIINKASQSASQAGTGNFGGLVLGCCLGLIWTPCAGPVLGPILALVATQNDLARAGILLFAYSLGAGLPMLLIAYGSQAITTKVRGIIPYTKIIQQIFGVLVIILAGIMLFHYDWIIQLSSYYPGLSSKY